MTARFIVGDTREVTASLADVVTPFGGLLRCLQCGREEPLGNVGGHLVNGWPSCCGYTMQWITQQQLDDE